MREFLPILLLIFGPILGAVLIGFIQLGIYTLLAKVGLVKADNIPMFPILLFRGLLILLGLIALAAITSKFLKGDAEDPLALILPIHEYVSYVR